MEGNLWEDIIGAERIRWNTRILVPLQNFLNFETLWSEQWDSNALRRIRLSSLSE